MKSTIIRLGLLALMISILAGCGGSNNDSAPPANSSVINSAAALAANDTSINPTAPFTVMTAAGVTPVTVATTTNVNFTVFSDGAVVQGLTASNARFAIAKLVPGTSGNPDQWVNYIYSTATGKNTTDAGVPHTAVLASAKQATTDSGGTLTYNADGYYTYTFKTDITDATRTNGVKNDGTNVTFEPGKTHRVAIQLSYTNKAGDTVLVNPYFDFTLDANGNAVAVSDPAKTRKMTDVASCNTCHDKLALHGGGRVDTNFCVMCHNSGTIDPESGNVLDLRTMAHKIHSGRRLAKDANAPEDYSIWGYHDTKHDYAEVGFPQDLRNCTKCHSSDNPQTPQGDNWKSKPSKEACLTCHVTGAGTKWNVTHIDSSGAGSVNVLLGSPISAAQASNEYCANCHSATSSWGAEQVHWNQNEENAGKYKVVIDSATFVADATAATKGKVTVTYHVDDTTNGNAKWDLTDPRFTNLYLIAGYNNIPGLSASVTEFSSYNNNVGSATRVYAKAGVNDGSNVYTADITIPVDIPGITEAKGTGRVVSYGAVVEPALDVVTRTPKSPAANINVSAKNTFMDFVISGTLTPRRNIVSNTKCEACHSTLGTTSGSNTLPNAFHSGARNTVEACGATCHDAGRGSSTLMNAAFTFPSTVFGGSGTANAMNESFQLKRMIHGIHGGERKLKNADGTYKYPLMHGTDNLTAEVAYPGILANCNTCHVDNSYQNDQGTLGSVVMNSGSTSSNPNLALRPLLLTTVSIAGAPTDFVDPLKNPVISPKVATCTACHDDPAKQVHMLTTSGFGGGVFGGATQGDVVSGAVTEVCTGCHAAGVVVGGIRTGVDLAHGLK